MSAESMLTNPPPYPTDTRRRRLLGYAAAVGAAFSFALGAVVVRKAVTDYSPPLVVAAYSMLFGTMVVAIIAGKPSVTDMVKTPLMGWALATTAGCISSTAAICFYLALDNAPVVLVSPVSGTSPLFAIIFTTVFLKRLERVTTRMVVGVIFVVIGVALVTIAQN